MPSRSRHRRLTTTILFALTAILVGCALGACGGSSSSSKTATTTQQARLTPNASNPDVGPVGALPAGGDTPSQSISSSTHKARAGKVRHTRSAVTGRSNHQSVQKAQPGPDAAGENNPALDKLPNPCRLVSASQAQSILGGPVAGPVEAPLGPTCIYQPKTNKTDVTLSVQTVAFAQATKHLAHRQSVALQGHQGVCGKLGTQMLYVSLGRDQVLNVTAPCSVAAKFASIAIAQLGA